MNLCILCEDANIVEARKRSESVLPKPKMADIILDLKKKKYGEEANLEHLKTAVSPTGELPATHWFCFIKVNEDTYQKMLDSQKYTIIEEGIPSEFLEKHDLKKIKRFGIDA
jgi:hypothetical protein